MLFNKKNKNELLVKHFLYEIILSKEISRNVAIIFYLTILLYMQKFDQI